MIRQPSAAQRALMEACFKLGVYFFWRGTGTFLISARGIQDVLREVIAQGYRVLGYEGFELDGSKIRPQLHLIYTASRRPDISDPLQIVADWPEHVWVDVGLAT
jgi:hypothetical protein